MLGERTSRGWEVCLQPRMSGRFASALSHGLILIAWALGLWYAAQFARSPLILNTDVPWYSRVAAGGVLVLWICFWTWGGIASTLEILRLYWSEDRIIAGPAGITLESSRGPFLKVVEITRDEITGILPSAPGNTLVVRTQRRTIVLTRNGTPSERREIASMIRSELGLPDTPTT